MTGYESKKAMAQDKITDEQGRPMTYWGGKAQPAQEPAIGDIRALKHRIHELEGEVIGYKRILDAQPAQDFSEQGRNRSAVLGNNVEAMMDAGLPFLKALETTLKVYDHDVPKLGCVNHDCDKCKAQPAQRPWVGLTDEERKPLIQQAMMYYGYNKEYWLQTSGAGFCLLVQAIEARLKDKNNG